MYALKSILGFAKKNSNILFEFVVVSPNANMEAYIHTSMEVCEHKALANVNMEFIQSTLLEYLQNIHTHIHTPTHTHTRKHTYVHTHARKKYNYIEYYGGINIHNSTHTHTQELNLMNDVLSDTHGVIGLTYFTKNIHTQNMFKLLQQQHTNTSISTHPPFSQQAFYSIHTYLDTYKMSFLKEDEMLMHFFDARRQKPVADPTHAQKRLGLSLGIPYSQHEVEKLVKDAGYEVHAWFPTAYSHPFGKGFLFVCV